MLLASPRSLLSASTTAWKVRSHSLFSLAVLAASFLIPAIEASISASVASHLADHLCSVATMDGTVAGWTSRRGATDETWTTRRRGLSLACRSPA